MFSPGTVQFESGSISDFASFLEGQLAQVANPFGSHQRGLDYQDVRVERPFRSLPLLAKSDDDATVVRSSPNEMDVNSSMKVIVVQSNKGKPGSLPPLDALDIPGDANHAFKFMGFVLCGVLLAIVYLVLGRLYAGYIRQQRRMGMGAPNRYVSVVAGYLFHDGIWVMVNKIFGWPMKLWDGLQTSGNMQQLDSSIKPVWSFPADGNNVHASELGSLRKTADTHHLPPAIISQGYEPV